MSLTLVKKSSATVSTPASGKITVFLDASGVLQGKDESGTVAALGGGGGGGGALSDGDYGDIVVSSSGTVMSLDTGVIVNADINASAAIAYSKLNLTGAILNADLAGSIADTKLSTIATAGKVSNSATTATSANTASAIVARDGSGNFSAGTITATLFSGSGASLTSLNGTQITSGTVPPAQLGSGSSISTKFLRGDSTWQTISGGGDALTTNPLSQFAATTSAQLAGVMSDETGSGALVFGTNPTLTGATLAGALACADNEVRRPQFLDYAETVNARGSVTGAQTFDYTLGNTVTLTMTGNVTVTLTNPPATGIAGSMTILLTQDGTGSRTVTWPASVKWGAAGAPTLTTTASKTDIITLITLDAGTTWRGSYALGFD